MQYQVLICIMPLLTLTEGLAILRYPLTLQPLFDILTRSLLVHIFVIAAEEENLNERRLPQARNLMSAGRCSGVSLRVIPTERHVELVD